MNAISLRNFNYIKSQLNEHSSNFTSLIKQLSLIKNNYNTISTRTLNYEKKINNINDNYQNVLQQLQSVTNKVEKFDIYKQDLESFRKNATQIKQMIQNNKDTITFIQVALNDMYYNQQKNILYQINDRVYFRIICSRLRLRLRLHRSQIHTVLLQSPNVYQENKLCHLLLPLTF